MNPPATIAESKDPNFMETPRERTAAHFLRLAQKLKSESGEKVQAGTGTPQERSEKHYLSVARKLKTA